VKKRFKFIQVVENRRWVFLSVLLLALLASPILLKIAQPSYEATSEVSYIGSGSASSANSLANAILPVSDLPDLVMSSEVIDRARQMSGIDRTVDEIRQTMTVKGSPHSNVVPIAVRSKSKSEALALANNLADATVTRYHELVSGQYDTVLAKIRAQLDYEDRQIHRFDAKLQSTVQQDSAVGAADSLDSISKNLTDLQTQRATAYATYVGDKAASSAQAAGSDPNLRSAIREQILTADPVYQQVKTSEAKDDAALASTKGGYTDSFPGLAGMEERVRVEKAASDKAARDAVSQHAGNSLTFSQLALNSHVSAALAAGDKARVDAIDQNIASARAELTDLPRYGVVADLARAQRDSAVSAYQALELRYQQTETDRSQAAALGAAFVLDHAATAMPKIPEFVLATLIAVFILGLAIGSAYAAEALDPRIRTAVDVEELYGAPRIGSI
jgi:capsular polysaccharide biosynthesis protein